MAGYLQGNDSHGGSYFIPMADMMAGLVFLFLIMVMTLAVYNVGEKTETTPAVTQEQPKEDPAVGAARRLTSEIFAARAALVTRIAEELSKRNVPVVTDTASGLLQFDAALFFTPGEGAMPTKGRQTLGVVSEVMESALRCFGQSPLPCPHPQPTRLELAIIQIEATADDLGQRADFRSLNAFASARALDFYAGMIGAQPALYSLTSDRNNRAITVQGRAADAGGTPRKGAPRTGTVTVAIEMIIPPLGGNAEKIGRD